MGKAIVIYTDASFDEKMHVAACGYVTMVDFKMISHNVYLVSGINSPKDAEEYAITLALRDLKDVNMFDAILINTDCLFCIYPQNKRRTNVNIQFKKEVNKFVLLGVKITMRHVKGHSNDHFNTLVDKSCRKHLRAHRQKNIFP